MVIFALTDNEKYDTTKKSKGKGIFKKLLFWFGLFSEKMWITGCAAGKTA